MSQGTTAPLLCRAAPPAQGPSGSTGREAGGNQEPGQASTDTPAWARLCGRRAGPGEGLWSIAVCSGMRRNMLCLPSCRRWLHQRGPTASTWMGLSHPPHPPFSSAVTADALNDLPVLLACTSSRGHSGAAVTVTWHQHSSHLSSACLSLAPLPCPVPAGMSGVGMRFLSPQ